MSERPRRAVLMICDGLRADLVRPDVCPGLCELSRSGTSFLQHRAIFPSVTRTSSASMATGHRPGQHGLHGNTMALPNGDGYAVHNVGEPKFVAAMRAARGRTLVTPVMAERLKDDGGSIIFSNVSPGAAYFHDPDGYGFVYHCAGSYGPGLTAVGDPLSVSPDTVGDRAMTARFCDEILLQRRPALSVLWLANPDKTMHGTALGSDEHLDSLAAVEACVKQVADTVATLRDGGEDILFLVGSDHGQETVRNVIPVERLLVDAGFKADGDSSEIVVAPQGTSALIYGAEKVSESRINDLAGWLVQQEWCDSVWANEQLGEVGMAPEGGLKIAISMAKSPEPNQHGVPGLSDVAVRFDTTEETPGWGQHGGMGRYEQNPFLIAIGHGFAENAVSDSPSSIIDIAPTILTHLGRPLTGLPGSARQSASAPLQ